MSSITRTPADREVSGAHTAVGTPVIACVSDGRTGRLAAEIADSLARRLRARLLLATVVLPAPSPLGRSLARHGRSLLANARHALDHPARMLVAFGEPAEQLIMLAQREAAEFLVVAAPQPAGSSTQLLGNVHLALAGAGPCPVVVVPAGLEIAPPDVGPIVCAVDGSAASQRAAEVAADLAHRLGTRLHVVHGSRLAAVADQVSAQLVVAASSGRERFAARCPLVIVPG